MFSDSNRGTQLTSVFNHTFLVRCSNGSTFFTNTANTTGVTIGAGGGSWASVSDVNKKENLVELDCQDVMNKMENLPIYQYNYIGNPKEQKCWGPTAQDWYKLFPTQKDQLSIETMDMIGVLMATVKNLNNRVKDLESKIGFMLDDVDVQIIYGNNTHSLNGLFFSPSFYSLLLLLCDRITFSKCTLLRLRPPLLPIH